MKVKTLVAKMEVLGLIAFLQDQTKDIESDQGSRLSERSLLHRFTL